MATEKSRFKQMGMTVGEQSPAVDSSKAPSIHNLTQAMIHSLETVERHVDGLNRSMSTLMGNLSKTMENVAQDIKDSNQSTTIATQQAAVQTEKSLKDIETKSEKSFAQVARASKRWMQDIVVGGIWGIVVVGIGKAIKAVIQAMEFNLFGWLEDRAKNVFKLLTDNIVGMNDALQSFRAGQQSAVEWQQSFGISVQLSRELQNLARANANEFINYTQYIEGYQAAMAGGIRGQELIASMGNLLAMTAQATGADIGMLGQLASKMTYEFSMDAGQIESVFDRANRFNQGLAERGIRSTTTGTYYENLLSRQGHLLELQAQGGNLDSMINASMASDAVSAAAGLDSNFLWDMFARGMTGEADVATLGWGSPQQVQEAIMSGNISPMISGMTEFVQGIFASDGNLEMVKTQLSDALGITMADAERLAIALGDENGGLTEIFNTLGLAVDGSIGTGLGEAARDNITPIKQLTNEMELFARNLSIGGVSMLDIVTNLEEIMPYIETMTGGIDLLQGSLEMAFGPLAPFITGPATFLATITGIGIATSELEEDERRLLGPLADYGDMAKNLINQLDTRFGGMISGLMDGIDGLFRRVDGGPSIFETMFSRGMDWLGGSGVEITNTVFGYVQEFLDNIADQVNQMDTAEGSPLGRFIGNLASKMASVFATGVHIVMPILREFLTALKDAMANPELQQGVREVMNTLAGVAGDVISFMWNDILQPIVVPMIGSIFSMIGNALQGSDNSILQGLGRTMSQTGLNLEISGALSEANTSFSGIMSLDEDQFGDFLEGSIISGSLSSSQVDELIRLWSIKNEGSTSAWGRVGQFALENSLPGLGAGINYLIDDSRQNNTDNAYVSLSQRATNAQISRNQIAQGPSGVLLPPMSGNMTLWSGQNRSNGDLHAGLDLSSDNGEVLAQGSGIVTFRGDAGTYGNLVRVYYPEAGALASYGHLRFISNHLKVGSDVRPGEFLGMMGSTGTTDGAVHLHTDLTPMSQDITEGLPEALSIGGGTIDRTDRFNLEEAAKNWGWSMSTPGGQQVSGATEEQTDRVISLLEELVGYERTRLLFEGV